MVRGGASRSPYEARAFPGWRYIMRAGMTLYNARETGGVAAQQMTCFCRSSPRGVGACSVSGRWLTAAAAAPGALGTPHRCPWWVVAPGTRCRCVRRVTLAGARGVGRLAGKPAAAARPGGRGRREVLWPAGTQGCFLVAGRDAGLLSHIPPINMRRDVIPAFGEGVNL